VDGVIRKPVNVCFREAATRHVMADQSPVRAASYVLHEGQTADLRCVQYQCPVLRDEYTCRQENVLLKALNNCDTFVIDVELNGSRKFKLVVFLWYAPIASKRSSPSTPSTVR